MEEKENKHELIVNGQRKTWEEEKISFEQVVNLAFPGSPSGQFPLYSVTYKNGPDENKQGTLYEGNSVYVKNGMNFDVTPTNRS